MKRRSRVPIPVARNKEREYVNEQIKTLKKWTIHLIDENKENLGSYDLNDAIELAQSRGLDLFCVSPKAALPVCRILDYGKHNFEKQKKMKQNKKNQTRILTKQLKISIHTTDHDLSYRIDTIREAAKKGNHAKVTLKLHGRYLAQADAGMDNMNKIIEKVSDIAYVDRPIARTGKFLEMYLVPNKATLVKLQETERIAKKALKQKKEENRKKDMEQKNMAETKKENEDGIQAEN